MPLSPGRTATVVLACLIVGPGARAATAEAAAPVPAVPDRAPARYVPARFDAQEIEGVLGERMAVNLEKRLLEGVETEALLTGFRQPPGQQTWIGEHIGKFIDAATNAWSYSRDERLKEKLDSAVGALLATQRPDGYLGTYLEPDRFIDLGSGEWEPNEKLPLWDVWVHKYDLISLLNYYSQTGYEPALAASRRIGDLLCRTYGEGPGQKSIARNDWHVGMANTSVLEPMAILYRYTGETRYLDFCRYIVRAWDEPRGPKILSTLLRTGRVRDVANHKAYEMTSNLVGLLELYRATGEETFLRAVLLAWRDVVENRLYITGGASWGELFREDHLLRADGRVGEGCVTTTWMQLNLQLLRLTGEAKYAEELERSVFNALLGAQHPENGLICYFVPLNGTKEYGTVSQGMLGVSCCTSSVTRGLSVIPQVAWGNRGGGIAVNLYVPGRVRLPAGGREVTLLSRTRYPEDGEVTLELKMARPVRFPLSLRVPAWCADFKVSAAGDAWTGVRGTYLEIDRTWKDGDQVKVEMDVATEVLAGVPAYPSHVALRRGPQVLAVDERLNPGSDPWMDDLWRAGLATEHPVLRPAVDRLPKTWHGRQAYLVDGYVGNAALGKRPIELTLVPLADAGQTGGTYRVWLQRP
jgi:DUF1680 family protein